MYLVFFLLAILSKSDLKVNENDGGQGIYPTSMLIDESSENHWSQHKIDRKEWVITADSEQTTDEVDEGPISNILDGQPSTIWISKINNQGNGGHDDRTNKNGPFKFIIDLKKRVTFKAFSLMPRQTGDQGKFRLYEFYAAHSLEELNTEMQSSKYVAKGQIDPNAVLSTLVILPYSITAQYIAVRSLDQSEAASCAEFNLYTDPDSTEPTPTPMAIHIDEYRDKMWLSLKIDREGWTATANSEQNPNGNDGPASYMIDGNKDKMWHSKYNSGHDDRPSNTDPFQATIDLGQETTFRAFSYMPRQKGNNGEFRHYDFYIAQTKEELDNKVKNEEYIAKGDISDPTSRLSTLVIFHTTYTARFIALRSLNHDGYATCAEFNLYSDSPTLPKFHTQLQVNELNDPGWNPYKINREGWNVTANSEQNPNNNDGPVSYMVDGNKDTMWHSKYNSGHDDRPLNTDPFQATIDLGQETTFEAFSYMPRQAGNNGQIKHFEFYAAQTREELDTLISETKYLAKGDIDPTIRLSTFVVFEAKVTAQYIALLSVNHDTYVTCAEFNLYSNIPNFYPEAPTPGPIPLSTQAIINEGTDNFWSSLRIDRTEWKIRANSQEKNEHTNGDGPVSFMINNDPTKWWHTRYESGYDDRQNNNDPYEVTIDLGKMETFAAFSYRPRGGRTGRFKHYQFYTANTTEELFIKINEKNYIAAGDINSNLDSSTFIIFKEQQTARHIALLSVNYNDNHATCAEFNLYRAPPSVPSDQSVITNQERLINLTCDKFTYENWPDSGKCVSSSQANLGSFSSTIGSKAKISFFGVKVHLLVMKEQDSGTGYIRIDDSNVYFVDFKSYTNGKVKSILFSSNELEYGEHTLEIECLSAKFIVFSSIYVDPLPKENSFALGFSDFKQIEGEWTQDSSTPPIFSSISEPASGTFEFYGTRFYLTGVRGSDVGNLDISIDEGDFISITESKTAPIAQNNKGVVLYDSGVIDFKMHTVKIKRSTSIISLINLFYMWYPNSETPAPTQTPSQSPTQTPSQSPTQTPIPDYDTIPVAQATGDYGKRDYLNKYKVPTDRFTYISSGDQNDHPLSLAFDGNPKTFWASSIITDETNKAIVNISFANTECIEAIIFEPAYSTSKNANPKTRRYDGFPKLFKVYTSIDGEPFKLHTVFNGLPEQTDIWDLVQYVFRQPIYCDKLQLEFTEVTLDVSFGNDYTAACADLWFVAPIPPATISKTPELTRTELPSHESYEGGIIENIADGKNNNMEFNCPIQEGSIKIYTICTACDKISKDQRVWFSVYFQNGNIYDVIHEDIIIHKTTHLSVFVPRNKIIYHPDTNILSYFIDSVNMKYVESELNLECFVPPKTPKATPSQSPTQTPSQSPTQTPSQSPTQTPSQSPTQTPSQSPAQTPSQSPAQTPSQSPAQTPSQSPAQTPSQSPAQTPSQSPAQTPSQSPAQTPSQSPAQTPSQSPAQTPSQSPAQTPSQSPAQTPSQSPAQTPSQSPTSELPETETEGETFTSETEPPTIIVDEIIYDKDNFTEDVDGRTRIEKEVKEGDNENINVVVKKSEFNKIENNNGGAVHLINCGIKTDGNIFTECKSKEGGGGAIFIENSNLFKNDVLFNGLKFTSCEAEYGGGAYIYSASNTNKVNIKSCIFKQNIATRSKSDDGKFGGAAMFLTVSRCIVRKCKFEKNDVKIMGDIGESTSLRILQSEESSLIFTDCKFKINENMKFSLFYYGGNYAADLKLQNCSFYGKLKDGAYFIDGQLVARNQPKMIINSCRFSSKSNSAINPNSQFVSINLKDQIFESSKFEDSSDENEKSMKSFIIFTALVMAVIIALVISLFIIIKKFISQKVYSNDNEELEISSQLNDISSNSLITSLI